MMTILDYDLIVQYNINVSTLCLIKGTNNAYQNTSKLGFVLI